MRITAVETFRSPVQPNVCFVRLHDDNGTTGLGEAFFHASSIETFVHDSIAELLLNHRDPTPQAVSALLRPYVGFQGGGVENRARGAIDIALWDLTAKTLGTPISTMLGGAVQESIPVYNTCAGTQYVGSSGWQRSDNWNSRDGDLEDLWAFMNRPGELAQELLREGFSGMKIWPFDIAAERNRGMRIPRKDLQQGVDIVRAIRDSVGEELDVMIELHGLWNPGPASEIAYALDEFGIEWIEDPVRADNLPGLSEVRAATSIPIAAGETVAGVRGFAQLLDHDAIDIATVDIQWTGGLSEAVQVAHLCDSRGIPIAPHDCTGPVTLATSVHLTAASPNGLIQETARAFMRSWYPQMVEGLPEIIDGRIAPSTSSGHGVQLSPTFVKDPRVVSRITKASRS